MEFDPASDARMDHYFRAVFIRTRTSGDAKNRQVVKLSDPMRVLIRVRGEERIAKNRANCHTHIFEDDIRSVSFRPRISNQDFYPISFFFWFEPRDLFRISYFASIIFQLDWVSRLIPDLGNEGTSRYRFDNSTHNGVGDRMITTGYEKDNETLVTSRYEQLDPANGPIETIGRWTMFRNLIIKRRAARS